MKSVYLQLTVVTFLLFPVGIYADTHQMDHGTMQNDGTLQQELQKHEIELNKDENHHVDHDNMHDTMPHSPSAHGDGQQATNQGTAQLKRLTEMPRSGKSREAGYDERYLMESTTVSNSIQTQCAQGSRGLVMVDNVTWSKCGGKPTGWVNGGKKRRSANKHQHDKE